MRPPIGPRATLLAICATALCVRLAFVAWAPGELTHDARFYHLHAITIANGHGYANVDASRAVLWPPGWPATIAAFYWTFGQSPVVVQVANAFFGAGAAGLLGILGAMLLSRRTGLVAAALYAVWPGLVFYSATLMTETAFSFWLLLGAVLVVAAARPSARHPQAFLFAAGLVLGFAALMRSEPIGLLPVLGLFLWKSLGSLRAAMSRLAFVVLAMALVILPWTWRNYRTFDRFIPISANAATVFARGNHAAPDARETPHKRGFSDHRLPSRGWVEAKKEGWSVSESVLARSDAGLEAGLAWIRENPAEWLALVRHKLWTTYASDADGATLVRGHAWPMENERAHIPFAQLQTLSRVANTWWYGVLALTAVGCATLGRWPPPARSLVLGWIATWFAIHALMIGHARLHVPEIPAFALLAASGLLWLHDRLRRPGGWRGFATTGVVALAALVATTGCGPRRAPPGVLLVVVDTLRRDRLGCYGHDRDTSPHIDRLATDAVRYERATSHAPWTTPSIGSLLSSRYPETLGIRDRRSALPEETQLVSETLRANGFVTGAIVSHTFCSAKWNFDQGFDHFDESQAQGHDWVSANGVTERALAFLDAHAEEPFFLWLHYFDPHFAYREHEGHRFDGDPEYAGPIESGLPFRHLFRRRGALDEADLEELLRLYDSEIALTDAQIGRVLERLRALGRYDDTLIVFTADHGEEFLEHGNLGHTNTLYEELVSVPLLIKYPRREGGVEPAPVGLVDVYPTILAALGLDAVPGLEGRSLAPNAPNEPAPQFSETARGGGIRSVRAGDWKLIAYDRDSRFELFDLASDPGERDDVAAGNPDVATRLRGVLASWTRRTRRGDGAANEVELSDDEREGLRALGYTE